MSYIEAPKLPPDGELFRDLPALGNDRAALILHRGRKSYLVLNKYPYNPGHLLAVPYRGAGTLAELTPAERADLMETITLGQEVLRAAIRPDGFNLGFNFGSAAGSSIPHLHAHIVPRWNGDTNFMPVVGQTRVLPQALADTYERLLAALPRARAQLSSRRTAGRRRRAPRARRPRR